MNTAEFIYLLNNPESTSSSQSLELESVLKEYPYFQCARSLYLKSLHLQNNFKFNSQLKLTAVHTTDRSILFDFIHSEDFKIISQKQKTEEQEALTDLENDPISNQNFEIEAETVHENENTEAVSVDSINQSEVVNPNTETILSEDIIPESPLEKSVLDSILIANEKKINEEETVATDIPAIQLENPLEKSILSSIEKAAGDEHVSQSNHDVFKEKTSWLEDNLDYEVPAIVEVKIDSNVENNENSSHTTEEISHTTEDVKSATLSFQQWLQISKIKPIERSELVVPKTENEVEKENTDQPILADATTDTPTELVETTEEKAPLKDTKMDLIDKFIETNPKIAPVKDNIPPPSYIAKKPDSPYLMTETLAKIYLEQKKYTKAIQAYEILILKYPEKSSLFADRILDIKELQQNNNR
ncbi:tetratricopeptide repeat protein [Flavobacterium sp.]|uniref:tetratricopeptide repeat protein n=1 Tax=Flavobacterium sp. TaxID=239 RepID=UPI003D0E9EA0